MGVDSSKFLSARMQHLAPGFYTERDGGRWYIVTPSHEDRIGEGFDDRDDARRLVCALAGDPFPEGWYLLNPGSGIGAYIYGPAMFTADIWLRPIEKYFPGALARLPTGCR